MAVEETERQDGSSEGKYSEEDVKKMIDEQLKEVKNKESSGSSDVGEAMEKLATLLSEKQNGKKDLEFAGDRKYVSIEDIDPEDRMESPAIFFTHQYGYLIVDDKRNGHPVPTPFGNKIQFNLMASKKHQKGRDEYHHHIATYSTYSKKEAEWLRNHRLFNIKFFDRIDHATQAHAQEAAAVARYYTELSNLRMSQLIEQAKNAGISVSMERDDMLHALAQNKAKKAAEQRKRVSRSILEGSQEDQEELDKART